MYKGKLELKDVPIGTPVCVHYKEEGRKPEWFEWRGFAKNVTEEQAKKLTEKDGYMKTGFYMVGKPIRGTSGIYDEKGNVAEVILFPETIEKIETED